MAAINRLDLLELAKVPYSLAVLAQLYDSEQGDLPPNQGRLFDQYINSLLAREDERAKKLYWPAARLALNQLGYQMQARGESAVLPAAEIEALIPASVRLPARRQPEKTPPPVVFDVACQADLLRLDPTASQPNAYKFTHQLLQEQLAAADLLRRWQQGEDLSDLWRVDLKRETMPPAKGGEWDPLPPPPYTGWEQPTLQAAGLPDYADTFTQAVLQANPLLAGRCLSEGFASVSDETRQQTQNALLNTLSNPKLHRRARVEAGRVLAQVGDPRFKPQKINGAQIILPEWLPVPGGRAAIGRPKNDPQAYDDERPAHTVEIAPFYLARYPVTNAEYACFIDAGGYNTETCWTPAGWQWRQGKGDANGPVEQFMENREFFKQNPDILERGVKEQWLTPDTAEAWREQISLSDEEARRRAESRWPQEAREKPYYWGDSNYKAPNQPVVGLSWYEAMAYAVWLNEQVRASGFKFRGRPADIPETMGVRLPTEAEWEWAAGGPEHLEYPWGADFDADKANTLEGRVMKPSSVGAYPGGAATCGALEMSGNVWEWTHSLYRPYPYRADDGREDARTEGRRVVRGGSWIGSQRIARVSVRYVIQPDVFVNVIGFRLVLAPALKLQ